MPGQDQQTRCDEVKHGHQSSSIASFPVELLTVIFGYLFTDIPSGPTFQEDGTTTYNPTPFPFNVARVCTRWRNIVGYKAEYWQHIPVVVDHIQPTPLSELAHYVEFARHGTELTISVFRTDRAAEKGGMDPDEPKRAQAAIEVLRPLFPRCRSIEFRVLHNASLPSFSEDLNAIDLTLLSFHANEPDRCRYPLDGPFMSYNGHPTLDILSASGFTAFEATINTSLFDFCRTIEISNYRSYPNDGLPAHKFLGCLFSSSVEELTLRNIVISSMPLLPTPGSTPPNDQLSNPR